MKLCLWEGGEKPEKFPQRNVKDWSRRLTLNCVGWFFWWSWIRRDAMKINLLSLFFWWTKSWLGISKFNYSKLMRHLFIVLYSTFYQDALNLGEMAKTYIVVINIYNNKCHIIIYLIKFCSQVKVVLLNTSSRYKYIGLLWYSYCYYIVL